MEYLGNNPNGLNQQNKDTISLFVSGSRIVNFSSQSVDVVGNFSASKIQTDEIDSFGSNPLQLKADTQISGSLNISSSISASLFRGDGSGLFNIDAAAIGDLNQIKSGSALAQISPNKGLVVNVPTSISGGLAVNGNSNITGSVVITQNLNVGGRITSTELHTTFISSSVIFSSKV